MQDGEAAELQVPAAHPVHADEPEGEKVPARHPEQLAAPADEMVPVAHYKQLSEEDCPTVVL